MKKCMLMIFDGFGIAPKSEFNAVTNAKKPFLDSLFAKYPHSELSASGEDVGLPEGVMGNSEVGHLNIGAGRVVYQELTRIDKEIKDKTLFTNKEILSVIELAKKNNSVLHLMGLLSDGGVHSHERHLWALLKHAAEQNVKDVVVHTILDGRDTPQKSALTFVKRLQTKISEINQDFPNTDIRFGMVTGRFWAMDRDKRWERLEKAYNTLIDCENSDLIIDNDPCEAIENAYAKGETDEFVSPRVIKSNKRVRVSDNDSFLFFNFRSDRAREISEAIAIPGFTGFKRNKIPNLAKFLCLTEYDSKLGLPVAYQPQNLSNVLAEVLAKHNLKQFHIAETEKYAHVTFFLNGGKEAPFTNEDRDLIASPKEVATYDLKPQMSAIEVTNDLLKDLETAKHDFIIINYANPDMVGHTGIYEAAIKAIETLDDCIAKVIPLAQKQGYDIIFTADHGNAEIMRDSEGKPHTAHTTNPVPVMLISDDLKDKVKLRKGILADVMPTILEIMNIPLPKEVTGKSLIVKK